MMLKNEIFATILDWLIKNKYVDDQKDLAKKTGITPTTISRIMTGKVEPSDDTLRKLNSAFGNIFNMQYLRGRSTTMLMKDAIYYEQHPEDTRQTSRASESEQIPYSTTPPWASILIKELTQKNEALTQELRSLHIEIASLRTILETLINTQKS